MDAKSVFWGTISRTDDFTQYFDPRVALATTSVEIVQQHTPRYRLPAILAQVQQIYDDAHAACRRLQLCN